jgi:hypothetical protein
MLFVVALGLGLGSLVGRFAHRGSPGNTALVASCLAAGVVGTTVMAIALGLGPMWMIVLLPLGVGYVLHPIALQALCGASKSRAPYFASIAVSATWVYVMFFSGR